jgi:hypothetical protein
MSAPVGFFSGAPVAQNDCASGDPALKGKPSGARRATATLPVAQSHQAGSYPYGQEQAATKGKGMMIKAIETRYKGYRFRSRLEARWAVFFDALGLEWEYEPEGFNLGDAGLYLPDFFLPNLGAGTWVEVKPNAFGLDEDKAKYQALVAGTGKELLFANGIPEHRSYLIMVPPSDGYPQMGNTPWWSECCFNAKYLPPSPHDKKPRLFYVPSGVEDADCFEAIEAARSARFEHGERP